MSEDEHRKECKAAFELGREVERECLAERGVALPPPAPKPANEGHLTVV